MRNIKQLLGLCEHIWKVKDEWDMVSGDEKRGHKYILQCSKCGELKAKRV